MEAVYFQYDERFEKLSLQDCVVQYKHSGNEFLLRAILYKLKGTINHYLYYKTDYPDKQELLEMYEDKLIDCLSTYDDSGKAQFVTYYTRCLSNALINFTKSKKNNDLSLDYDYDASDDSEATSSLGDKLTDENNHDIDNKDSQLLLEQLKDKLDDNEYRVCQVILGETHNLTHTEIAKEIGLTVPAIKGIFDRLQKRFIAHGICKNNL
jgi:RNA polymerase sigma factor (sigma-70 family)